MDVPWMRGVADFVKGITQCTLLVGLTVDRDGILGVLDLQVDLIPMHRGRLESSEYAE